MNIRKFLLRGLYGESFKTPYNENMVAFRTSLRCLVSLYCLSRCSDYMEIKRCDIECEDGNVIIAWRKRKNNQRSKVQISLVPRLPNHPLCLYNALSYYSNRTELKDDQFVNCKLSRTGKAYGTQGIARNTCYDNIRKLCSTIDIDPITEKMFKSLGTR